MNWRTLVGICAGVLLPLPLVLVGKLLWSVERPEIPTDGRISPMLNIEQRSQLMTYGRPCGSSSECEPPLGCLFETRTGQEYCTDSQCTQDTQCSEGQVCRPLATSGDGPRVRFCLPIGVRQEGEGCVKVPDLKDSACAEGLICGSKTGWCSKPCSLGSAAAGCREGFFCADTIPQPVCLPTCEKRGCPTGQQCVRFDDGASVCAQVYGPNCQQTPCPDGRECEVQSEPPHPGKVWMECVERCGEDGLPPCGAGMICDGWQCKPDCNPQGPDTCGEGYRCRLRRPDRPFACQPDW